MLGGRRIVTLTLGLVGLLGGCRSDAPPPGVEDVRIVSPWEYHRAEGFVRLVPPVHLPSSSPERDQVEIWVKLPDGPSVDVELDERHRPTLRFAPGTWADRVEFVGRGDARRIVDIRGTRIEDDGSQTFYVYRPAADGPKAPLLGVEWARDDPQAHAAATDHFLATLAEAPLAASMPEAKRARFLEGIRNKQGCAGCHGYARPDNETPRQHGVVDRGTDLSGFFTPQTVLWDEVAIEAYGAHDRNGADPAVEIYCGDAPGTAPAEGERRCPDGSIAHGRLRWEATEPVAKAHLDQVCESRAILFAHMAPKNRAKMAQAAESCEKR